MESHDAEFSKAGRGHVPAPKPKPSRFHATPAEIDQFLREHFAEDRIQLYQWAIGDWAVTEAALDVRSDTNLRQLEGEHQLAEYGRELADLIDPMKGGGHYPSVLMDFTPKEQRHAHQPAQLL